MITTPPLDVAWRKSSRSGTNGACVEVRLAGDTVQVRDSKERATGPVLAFTHKEWTAFLDGVQLGEFAIPTMGHQTYIAAADVDDGNG